LFNRLFTGLFNNLFNNIEKPSKLRLHRGNHKPKGSSSGPLLQPLDGLGPLAGQQRPRHQGLQGHEAAAVHPLLHQSLGHELVPFGHRRQQTIRQVGASWRGKAGGKGHGRAG